MKNEVDTKTKLNNIYPINSKNQELSLSPTIAVVHKAHQGEAVIIFNEDNDTYYEVDGHLYGVPELTQTDKVYVTFTKQGTIVTDRYRKENEKPTKALTQNEDGSLNINSDNDITFKTLNAKIEIKADGHVTISGTTIDSISEGINQLKGSKIDLNC